MRLALALGWPNADGMLAAMPAYMFWRWLAYLDLEPAGPHVDDMRHAQLITLLANAYRAEDSIEFELSDFMIGTYDTGQPEPGAERAAWQEVKTWAMAHNARLEAGL